MTRQATAAIAQVEDLQVAYDATDGSGPPVVFLHGLAEDRATWAFQMATATSRPCFAYDLRGHGETSIGDANGTLQQLGRDLLAFLRLVSGPSTVVGFSLGGTIALWAAAIVTQPHHARLAVRAYRHPAVKRRLAVRRVGP